MLMMLRNSCEEHLQFMRAEERAGERERERERERETAREREREYYLIWHVMGGLGGGWGVSIPHKLGLKCPESQFQDRAYLFRLSTSRER